MSSSPQKKRNRSTRLQHSIKLLESIRSGQEPLWNDPRRGFAIDPSDKDTLTSLQRESLNQNVPLSHLLDDHSFNFETLRQTLITLVYEMNELEIDPSIDPLKLVKRLDEILSDLIMNVLRLNQTYFVTLGDQLVTSPLVLSLIGSSLLQPSMIALASHCERQYLDAWGLTACPICGRLPSVAVKEESEAWRFRCSYCRAEYEMDIGKCPHCGSEGFDNKEFLLVGEDQEYEVAACPECSRYYKIINTAKLGHPIPEGLEDPYTEILDEIAHEKGLIRLDEAVTDE
jgi:formate dehydrogenase maturation protein FdhE